MFGRAFSRFKAGQRLNPKRINQALEAAERAGRIELAAPLAAQTTPAGTLIRLAVGEPFYAKITSGTGPYAWIEQIPAPGGTWTDGWLSGTVTTNGAYNNIPGVTLTLPIYVDDMTFTTAAEYRFTARTCS